MHKGDDEIRGLSIVRRRQIEMIDMGANVGDNRRNFRAPIGRAVIDDEYADRFVELADPFFVFCWM